MANLWVTYVKKIASEKNMSYSCALCEATTNKGEYFKFKESQPKPPRKKRESKPKTVKEVKPKPVKEVKPKPVESKPIEPVKPVEPVKVVEPIKAVKRQLEDIETLDNKRFKETKPEPVKKMRVKKSKSKKIVIPKTKKSIIDEIDEEIANMKIEPHNVDDDDEEISNIKIESRNVDDDDEEISNIKIESRNVDDIDIKEPVKELTKKEIIKEIESELKKMGGDDIVKFLVSMFGFSMKLKKDDKIKKILNDLDQYKYEYGASPKSILRVLKERLWDIKFPERTDKLFRYSNEKRLDDFFDPTKPKPFIDLEEVKKQQELVELIFKKQNERLKSLQQKEEPVKEISNDYDEISKLVNEYLRLKHKRYILNSNYFNRKCQDEIKETLNKLPLIDINKLTIKDLYDYFNIFFNEPKSFIEIDLNNKVTKSGLVTLLLKKLKTDKVRDIRKVNIDELLRICGKKFVEENKEDNINEKIKSIEKEMDKKYENNDSLINKFQLINRDINKSKNPLDSRAYIPDEEEIFERYKSKGYKTKKWKDLTLKELRYVIENVLGYSNIKFKSIDDFNKKEKQYVNYYKDIDEVPIENVKRQELRDELKDEYAKKIISINKQKQEQLVEYKKELKEFNNKFPLVEKYFDSVGRWDIYDESFDKNQGSGILPSIRRDYSPNVRNVLNKYGNMKIKSAVVQRVPIESMLKNVLNVISLGKFKEQTKKLGYDKVFHLSLIVVCENGTQLVIEKNEVINISTKIPPMKKGGERMNVTINKDITLNQLLENAQQKIGSKFFLYDAFKNNCQMFIDSLLTHSGLNTPELKKFILQDAGKILEGMPFYMKDVARGLTNLGAQFNRIIYGKGKCMSKE
jgi:hypothetical protein